MTLNKANLDDEARKVLEKLCIPPPRPRQASESTPAVNTTCMIIGLTGLQGSGKSTWASALVKILQEEYKLHAITVSLDDLYRDHGGLVKLRESDPTNGLYRTRGQPGTHDEVLAMEFFAAVRNQDCDGKTSRLRIPSFNKSCYGGEGDRAPFSVWPEVSLPLDVVIFEGWCVGFQPCAEKEVGKKYDESHKLRSSDPELNSSLGGRSTITLADHDLGHLLQVNEALDRYCKTFMGPQHFDGFIHLDTNDLKNVYDWRLDQEHALLERTGSGMSDEQVIDFVRGYMPAYELYIDDLRSGFFKRSNSGRKTQVRVCLDRERRVVSCELVG